MRKPFIFPYLENGVHYEFEFDSNIINPLIDFIIGNSFDIVEKTGCQYCDIILCMPNYLIEFLKYQHKDSIVNAVQIEGTIYFCNIKTQISYTNEIVLFYNSFDPKRIIKYVKEL